MYVLQFELQTTLPESPDGCTSFYRCLVQVALLGRQAERRKYRSPRSFNMKSPRDTDQIAELYELYAELHLACGRAAAALRLSGNWDAPTDELLARFRKEEAHAAEIWKRIQALSGS